jgi:ABC-type branched-subunit amino acid transport system permease subunit
MTGFLKARGLWFYLLGVTIALLLPQIFTTRYALSVLVLTGMFIIFALSYDLSVGHVGTVHLAAPAFFGLGAYVTGLIGVPLQLNFFANLLLSAAVMALFAQLVGVPSFRLSHVTFAIGTLAFATACWQVINSAVDITRGPLCVQRIPRPQFVLPGVFELRIVSTAQYYYLLVPLVFITILIYRALTMSRIGRAFAAVRDDEVRAAAAGVYPLRYKMLAFTVGAAIAGALGSFQAQYLTVLCPTELAGDYTIRLLIIIFVGGAGSLTGLLLGAIIFTVLPELMRGLGNVQVTPAHQLIIFGLILLLVIKYAPGGLQEVWMQARRRLPIRRPTDPTGDDRGSA